MGHTLFNDYADFLLTSNTPTLEREISNPERLLIEAGVHGRSRLSVAYAPFDHVHSGARLVIVGLTPGRQQMRNALLEAQRLLKGGASIHEAMAGAKVHASFSGPMRNNLIAMMDHIGIHRLLGLESTASLWGPDGDRVHFTSALRYPVFVNDQNYSGAPNMLQTPMLRKHLESWFGAEVSALRGAVFVPLGPKVDEAVRMVASEHRIDPHQVLSGLPHPSGANAERIAFFLGRKDRLDLSNKVAPDRLIAARTEIETKVTALEG